MPLVKGSYFLRVHFLGTLAPEFRRFRMRYVRSLHRTLSLPLLFGCLLLGSLLSLSKVDAFKKLKRDEES